MEAIAWITVYWCRTSSPHDCIYQKGLSLKTRYVEDWQVYGNMAYFSISDVSEDELMTKADA